jgi:hypothetical protein
MMRDSIVEEVRAIRDDIARQHNYDVQAIFEMLRAMEVESHRELATLPPRRTDQQLLVGADAGRRS